MYSHRPPRGSHGDEARALLMIRGSLCALTCNGLAHGCSSRRGGGRLFCARGQIFVLWSESRRGSSSCRRVEVHKRSER
eukprot:7391784-Prymnesium_polylepis.2